MNKEVDHMRKYNSEIRSSQAEETKRKLSMSLAKICEKNDLKSISIKALCDSIEVAVGTFYLYFKNKEEALLYSYHVSDDYFNSLNLDEKDVLESLEAIFQVYFKMMSQDEATSSLKQTYIAHLSYYDDYFFSKTRSLFSLIDEIIQNGQEQKIIIDTIDSDALADKLLRFARGILYDLAIRYIPVVDNQWRQEAVADMMQYLSLFLIKEGM